MAVPAVTLDFPTPARVGNTAMGLLMGTVNISTYDAAHPAVTAITGKFKPSGKLRVVCNGLSSNGYAVQWDPATSSFKAFRATVTVGNPTVNTTTNAGTATPMYTNGGALTQVAGAAGITGVIQGAVAAAAPTEAGAVNVGTVDFIAVGQLG